MCLLVYNCWCVCGTVLLQLCPEDDGEHRETNGSSQSQVRVQQQGEDEGGHPDQLQREGVMMMMNSGQASVKLK